MAEEGPRPGVEPGTACGIRQHILLLAAAGGGPIAGRAGLQMMVCNLSEENAGAGEGYRPGPDGQYSGAVDRELDCLVGDGMMSDGGTVAITAGGRRAAEGLAGALTGTDLLAFRSCKRVLNGLGRDEAPVCVCWARPDMGEPGSYGRPGPDIERHVLSMKARRMISAECGAGMLEITLPEMWRKMDEYGIPMPRVEDEDSCRVGSICHTLAARTG